MLLRLRQIVSQFKEFWQEANPGLKRRLVFGLVLGLAAVTAVLVFTRPVYKTLFSNLSPADAGQIGQRLQDMNVAYRLGDDGKSILVPHDKVYELRNRLAMEGLPKGGGVGFEVFDNTRLGMTDFERRIEYLRALRGELARTISQLEGVRSVEVELVLPEERLFSSEQHPATASVLIDPIGQLEASQVRAITHLVSHSVEGLLPENITVIDTHGQVLSDLIVPAMSATGLSTSQLQLQSTVEREIERKVQSMLEHVLGPRTVITRVKAELCFDQQEVTKELYEPVIDDEGIVRSMEELKRTFDGTAEAGGAVGTETNIPGYSSTDNQAGHYEEAETRKNYEVNQTREHFVLAPGNLKHLSVSVLVDSNREGGFGQAELDAVRTAVAHAVGLRDDRQDQVSVISLPFSVKEPEPVPELPWYVRFNVGRIVMALLGLLVIAVLLRTVRSRRAQPTAAPATLASSEDSAQPPEDPEAAERERVRKAVQRLAQERPAELAQLLSTWLVE